MPLYIGDYLADTAHLTIEQSGAYLHLLMSHWRVGYVPDDDSKLAAICRVTKRRWAREFGPVLRAFFKAADGKLTQGRLLTEREKAAKTSSARSANAKKKWSMNNHGAVNENNDITSALAEHLHEPGILRARVLPSHSQSEKKDSEASPLAQAPIWPDIRTELWNDGLTIIRNLTGKPEGASRGLLGKVLKATRDDCASALRILREAESLRPVDPLAWIMGAAKSQDDPMARLMAAAGLASDGPPIIEADFFSEIERGRLN